MIHYKISSQYKFSCSTMILSILFLILVISLEFIVIYGYFSSRTLIRSIRSVFVVPYVSNDVIRLSNALICILILLIA